MMLQIQAIREWMANHKLAALIIKIVIGANLMAIFSQITIPLPLVPITGQTFTLIVVGLSMGRNAAVGAMLLYYLEGIMGIPVFAGATSGIAKFTGSTGGYLIGFLPAIWLLGHFSDKGVLNSFWKSFAVTMAATVIIYIFGLAQLSFFVPTDKLLSVGFIPFIPGGIVKGVLASLVISSTHKLFNKI